MMDAMRPGDGQRGIAPQGQPQRMGSWMQGLPSPFIDALKGWRGENPQGFGSNAARHQSMLGYAQQRPELMNALRQHPLGQQYLPTQQPQVAVGEQNGPAVSQMAPPMVGTSLGVPGGLGGYSY